MLAKKESLDTADLGRFLFSCSELYSFVCLVMVIYYIYKNILFVFTHNEVPAEFGQTNKTV